MTRISPLKLLLATGLSSSTLHGVSLPHFIAQNGLDWLSFSFLGGHCQKLAPVFEELARALEHDNTVSIAKVDCTEYRPICKEFDVKGYPTLLWMEDGKKVDKYSGPRSLDDLKAYVDQRTSGEGVEKPAEKVEVKEEGEGAAILQLNTENFVQGIETGVTFVKFFAPWCKFRSTVNFDKIFMFSLCRRSLQTSSACLAPTCWEVCGQCPS